MRKEGLKVGQNLMIDKSDLIQITGAKLELATQILV